MDLLLTALHFVVLFLIFVLTTLLFSFFSALVCSDLSLTLCLPTFLALCSLSSQPDTPQQPPFSPPPFFPLSRLPWSLLNQCPLSAFHPSGHFRKHVSPSSVVVSVIYNKQARMRIFGLSTRASAYLSVKYGYGFFCW